MFVFYNFDSLIWVTASTPRCLGDQIDVQKSSKVVQTALWIGLLLYMQPKSAAQAPRLGSLGLARVLRGALDGAVHEDKDVCKVASMEARFLGC